MYNRLIELFAGIGTKIIDDYYDMNIKYSRYVVLALQLFMFYPLFYWVNQGNNYIFSLLMVILTCIFCGQVDTKFYKVFGLFAISLTLILILQQGVVSFFKSVDPFVIVVMVLFFICVNREEKEFQEEYSQRKIIIRTLVLFIVICLYFNKEIIGYGNKVPHISKFLNRLNQFKPINYLSQKINIPLAKSAYTFGIGYFSTSIITMLLEINK